ncbi:DUF6551 family protein [Sphingobium yanoikuyae]|uniref:Uncharacterized protein n=1 Tax=Sphingobium yanoikuyae TaxID=13690 RepID=A0A3G2UTR4_SPHYA|nr:DUF6551 family protein [Sphingobium yanoikuyae]AYO78335.1 hypothetical protein EBF16_16430 [Sphingobium yanoikuyae]
MSGAVKMSPQCGQRPSLEYRPVGDLKIDPSYQRSIESPASQVLIKRIARTWDWRLCQPLDVARRPDGALYVTDGQHRLAAALVRGDIYDLPCVITPSKGPTDEAASFVALNQQRLRLSKIELFKAALAAGNVEAHDIREALEGAGLSVASTTNPESWKAGQVVNIAGLELCLRNHGLKALRMACLAGAVAFHGQVLRYWGTIFPGIVAAVVKHGADDSELITLVLGACGQDEWRDMINRAKADSPNINMRAAAEIAVLGAIDEARGADQ